MRKIVVPLVVLLALCAPVPAASGPNIPIGDSPSIGPADAPVTIIEFIDFQ